MKQYVERMHKEKEELERKIKKAKAVIEIVPFGMDKKQILLLAEQVKAMEQYLSVLNERIEYENAKDK